MILFVLPLQRVLVLRYPPPPPPPQMFMHVVSIKKLLTQQNLRYLFNFSKR